MKVVAFGASTSKNSINKKFATFVAHQIGNIDVEVIDLNNYELPLFSVDLEKEVGKHPNAIAFLDRIHTSKLLVVSMSEHNSNFTAAFKNLYDWCSRARPKLMDGLNVFLVSTSPGGRGGSNSLNLAEIRFGLDGANIVAKFSLPKFNENFNDENGIVNDELRDQFNAELEKVKTFLTQSNI